jgi:hypothetical protein
MASSLIHLPMVPIHEFGHILFRPFGEFMTLLGGSRSRCCCRSSSAAFFW